MGWGIVGSIEEPRTGVLVSIRTSICSTFVPGPSKLETDGAELKLVRTSLY